MQSDRNDKWVCVGIDFLFCCKRPVSGLHMVKSAGTKIASRRTDTWVHHWGLYQGLMGVHPHVGEGPGKQERRSCAMNRARKKCMHNERSILSTVFFVCLFFN